MIRSPSDSSPNKKVELCILFVISMEMKWGRELFTPSFGIMQ
jgi:hypothetical protein